MPDVPPSLDTGQALVVFVGLLITLGYAILRRTNSNTERDSFVTQMAANSQKATNDAADARIAAADARAEARIANNRIDYLERQDVTNQATIADLRAEIRAANTEISELKAQVAELTRLLSLKTDEKVADAAVIADLRTQLAAEKARSKTTNAPDTEEKVA